MKFCFTLLLTFFLVQVNAQHCQKSTVYFKSGKYNLSPASIYTIDSLIQKLNPDSTYLIEVQGHTDKIGTEKRNDVLAKKRMLEVLKYINRKNLPNAVVIYDYYGESRPISKQLEINRRTTISTMPINADKTISLKGNGTPSLDLKVTANYFNNCGVCDTFPVIKSTTKTDAGNLTGGFRATIESPCEWDQKCIAAEFRYPKDFFESTDEIKVPRPLYTISCGKLKDSVDVKEFEKFEIRFDSLSDEYVISHPCYNPDWIICCGFQNPFNTYIYHLPENLTTKKSYYFIKNQAYKPGILTPLVNDSLVVIGDTSYFKTNSLYPIKDTLWSMGYLNEEPYFLKFSAHELPTKIITDSEGFYMYHLIEVPLNYYSNFNYSDVKVKVKLPKESGVLQVGYLINQFNYFIPFDQTDENKFEKAELDYNYQIALVTTNDTIKYNPEDLKLKYKKNRKLMKIKVKPYHLFVLPDGP